MVWWGTPCTTLSRAKKWDGLGPPPLRDPVEPTLPAEWASQNDIAKVFEANSLVELTVEGSYAIEAAGGVFIIESPEKSRLWEMCNIKMLQEQAKNVTSIVTHDCK